MPVRQLPCLLGLLALVFVDSKGKFASHEQFVEFTGSWTGYSESDDLSIVEFQTTANLNMVL